TGIRPPALDRAWTGYGLVQTDRSAQVRSLGADVPDLEHGTARDLPLHIQAPLLHVPIHQIRLDVPRGLCHSSHPARKWPGQGKDTLRGTRIQQALVKERRINSQKEL